MSSDVQPSNRNVQRRFSHLHCGSLPVRMSMSAASGSSEVTKLLSERRIVVVWRATCVLSFFALRLHDRGHKCRLGLVQINLLGSVAHDKVVRLEVELLGDCAELLGIHAQQLGLRKRFVIAATTLVEWIRLVGCTCIGVGGVLCRTEAVVVKWEEGSDACTLHGLAFLLTAQVVLLVLDTTHAQPLDQVVGVKLEVKFATGLHLVGIESSNEVRTARSRLFAEADVVPDATVVGLQRCVISAFCFKAEHYFDARTLLVFIAIFVLAEACRRFDDLEHIQANWSQYEVASVL